MTPRHSLLLLALVGAAALAFLGDGAPSSAWTVAEPAERRGPAAARAPVPSLSGPPTSVASASPPPLKPASAASAGSAAAGALIVGLIPREELIGETGEAALGGGDSAFRSQNWTPPLPPAAPPAPPPPSAPPLPFVYLGKASADGGWEVFLARGAQTYVVRPQTVIDGAYRVDAVAPPTLTMTYLPLNQTQQLNIGVTD